MTMESFVSTRDVQLVVKGVLAAMLAAGAPEEQFAVALRAAVQSLQSYSCHRVAGGGITLVLDELIPCSGTQRNLVVESDGSMMSGNNGGSMTGGNGGDNGNSMIGGTCRMSGNSDNNDGKAGSSLAAKYGAWNKFCQKLARQ